MYNNVGTSAEIFPGRQRNAPICKRTCRAFVFAQGLLFCRVLDAVAVLIAEITKYFIDR